MPAEAREEKNEKHRKQSRDGTGIESQKTVIRSNLHIRPPCCIMGKNVLDGKREPDVLGFPRGAICGSICG
jgi:hypothetical protein